jgi:hypothetical protein
MIQRVGFPHPSPLPVGEGENQLRRGRAQQCCISHKTSLLEQEVIYLEEEVIYNV